MRDSVTVSMAAPASGDLEGDPAAECRAGLDLAGQRRRLARNEEDVVVSEAFA